MLYQRNHIPTWAVFLLAFLLLCTATSANDSTSKHSESLLYLQQMGDEYKRLRKVKGHFQGESWNDDVDRWHGKKHRAMIDLAQEFSKGGYTTADLYLTMGDPDKIISNMNQLKAEINLPKVLTDISKNNIVQIYNWRGTHDFLYFVSMEDTISLVDWWYGGE